jgi:hypothetical protein
MELKNEVTVPVELVCRSPITSSFMFQISNFEFIRQRRNILYRYMYSRSTVQQENLYDKLHY